MSGRGAAVSRGGGLPVPSASGAGAEARLAGLRPRASGDGGGGPDGGCEFAEVRAAVLEARFLCRVAGRRLRESCSRCSASRRTGLGEQVLGAGMFPCWRPDRMRAVGARPASSARRRPRNGELPVRLFRPPACARGFSWRRSAPTARGCRAHLPPRGSRVLAYTQGTRAHRPPLGSPVVADPGGAKAPRPSYGPLLRPAPRGPAVFHIAPLPGLWRAEVLEGRQHTGPFPVPRPDLSLPSPTLEKSTVMMF